MKKEETFLSNFSMKQIEEISQKNHPLNIKPLLKSTRLILQKQYGKRHNDFILLRKASYMFNSYYWPQKKKLVSSFKGSGAFGSYFKISERQGVKVLSNTDKKVFKTKNDLLKSKYWTSAKKEFRLQKKASKNHSFVVKVYELFVLFNLETGGYEPAILMEHIVGRHIQQLYNRKLYIENEKYLFADITNLSAAINLKLKKSKIFHKDIHKKNFFIIKNNKIKLIDFGLAKELK